MLLKQYFSSTGSLSAVPCFKCPERIGDQVSVICVKDHATLQSDYDIWMVGFDELGVHRKLSELNKNDQEIEFSFCGFFKIMADEQGYLYIPWQPYGPVAG